MNDVVSSLTQFSRVRILWIGHINTHDYVVRIGLFGNLRFCLEDGTYVGCMGDVATIERLPDPDDDEARP